VPYNDSEYHALRLRQITARDYVLQSSDRAGLHSAHNVPDG
jgi:hypothetical protein